MLSYCLICTFIMPVACCPPMRRFKAVMTAYCFRERATSSVPKHSPARLPLICDRASFIPGLAEKLRSSGRLTLVSGERVADLLPDRLRFIFTSGHTPAQMHTVFRAIKAPCSLPGT